jgi:hypothetical protein
MNPRWARALLLARSSGSAAHFWSPPNGMRLHRPVWIRWACTGLVGRWCGEATDGPAWLTSTAVGAGSQPILFFLENALLFCLSYKLWNSIEIVL